MMVESDAHSVHQGSIGMVRSLLGSESRVSRSKIPNTKNPNHAIPMAQSREKHLFWFFFSCTCCVTASSPALGQLFSVLCGRIGYTPDVVETYHNISVRTQLLPTRLGVYGPSSRPSTLLLNCTISSGIRRIGCVEINAWLVVYCKATSSPISTRNGRLSHACSSYQAP
ncbi:hypothetical protein BDV10DRAFT_117369 [Aspergillus recurvatus]